MTCRELAELLADYLADELAEESRVTMRSHLEACPHCVHFVETYQLTIQISRRLPAAAPPEALLTRLQRLLENES
jgi:anti-sigma factor RsiW